MTNNGMPTLDALIISQRGLALVGCVMAFDPGETVGWALFDGPELIDCGQHRTTEWTRDQIIGLRDLIRSTAPHQVVFESYRVYGWKTDSHANNEMHTSQIIGILRETCLEWDVPYAMQSAQIAKQFVTDDKLKAWNLWQTGQKHARDAIRHAVYWQIFGSSQKLWNYAGAPTEKPPKK